MIALLMPHRVRHLRPDAGPENRCEAVVVAGQLRFAFMFVTPLALIGNSLDGWTDISGRTEQFLEWSADGEKWQRRQFTESREVMRADGQIEVWSISRQPLDGPAAARNQYARLGIHYHRMAQNWK